MKSGQANAPVKRAYRQGARAVAAEQTAARIIAAFKRRIAEDWYDQITLEEIAAEAEVTVPTILRRFGNKESLLQATWEELARGVKLRREVSAGDAVKAVRAIVEDYEELGDLVLRSLAQEERFTSLKTVNDRGRREHRDWIETTFAPWLDELSPAARRQRIDALVSATDLYIWKLVRRDMGRSVPHVRAVMLDLVEGAIGERVKAR